MAYENLLIRERADLADNKDEYEKQIKIADDWVHKALATKKVKAEKKAKPAAQAASPPSNGRDSGSRAGFAVPARAVRLTTAGPLRLACPIPVCCPRLLQSD